MSEPVRLFTDNPSSTLAWLGTPGGVVFLEWVQQRRMHYWEVLNSEVDIVKIHRAQGALEVLNLFYNLHDTVVKHEHALAQNRKS